MSLSRNGLRLLLQAAAACSWAACDGAAGDPCAGPPPVAPPRLRIGTAPAGTAFSDVGEGDAYVMVMGEQGSPMLDRLALRGEGMVPMALGRTREGWSLTARWPDERGGALLSEVVTPHIVRPLPGGSPGAPGFEVVDVRLIPDAPANDVWEQAIRLVATARGRCGEEAAAAIGVRVVRP